MTAMAILPGAHRDSLLYVIPEWTALVVSVAVRSSSQCRSVDGLGHPIDGHISAALCSSAQSFQIVLRLVVDLLAAHWLI